MILQKLKLFSNRLSSPSLYHVTRSRVIRLFLLLLCVVVLLTSFLPLVLSDLTVGIGSYDLSIGDKEFYINMIYSDDSTRLPIFSPRPIYPLIISIFTKISTSVFTTSRHQTVLLNSLLVITSTVLIFFTSILVWLTTNKLFSRESAEISVYVFALNPYVYFYSLSGGITAYIIFLVAISSLFVLHYLNNSQNALLATCGYVSIIALGYVRPESSIYSVIASIILLCTALIRIYNRKENLTHLVLSSACLTFSGHALVDSIQYASGTHLLVSALDINYFGVPKKYISTVITQLDLIPRIITRIAYVFTDRFTAISGLRETYGNINDSKIAPFLMRTATSAIYLYPLNILVILSFIRNFHQILQNRFLLIVLLNIFVVASSVSIAVPVYRYLFPYSAWIYTLVAPFIIQLKPVQVSSPNYEQ